jgi:hypothetical protein
LTQLCCAADLLLQVLHGGKVPATASFNIKNVRNGLTSVSGLVHVHGQPFNKQKMANLTSCGKSVDQWPLTGVLLQDS